MDDILITAMILYAHCILVQGHANSRYDRNTACIQFLYAHLIDTTFCLIQVVLSSDFFLSQRKQEHYA